MEQARVPRIACSSADLRHPVEATARRPRQHHQCWRGFQFHGQQIGNAAQLLPAGSFQEDKVPISRLLARIRRLVPRSGDQHYYEIVRSFGVGTLRPPPTPMSDGELARAIAEFLKEHPSSESVGALGRRLDPTTPL